MNKRDRLMFIQNIQKNILRISILYPEREIVSV